MDLGAIRQKLLFLGLTDPQLQALATIARTRTLRAGEVLARRGDRADAIYLLERGKVELLVAERVATVFEKGSFVDAGQGGDFFGEFCLLGDEPWGGTLVAKERTVLLEVRRDDLRELFARDHDLEVGVLLNMARALCRRLRSENQRGRSPT